MYKQLCPEVQEESVVGNLERFPGIEVGIKRYVSSMSRSVRFSYVLALWVSKSGRTNPYKSAAKISLSNRDQLCSF